jgi:hydrogenase-1 operon protein HyaF
MEHGMHRIDSIPVDVRETAYHTANLLPLLHELRHALVACAERGETHSIDLNRLPLAPAESAQLEQLLGRGEITARLQALGDSEIVETRLPGVWRITHRNADGTVVARLLEITDCPAILKTPQQDLADGALQLEQLIKEQM